MKKIKTAKSIITTTSKPTLIPTKACTHTFHISTYYVHSYKVIDKARIDSSENKDYSNREFIAVYTKCLFVWVQFTQMPISSENHKTTNVRCKGEKTSMSGWRVYSQNFKINKRFAVCNMRLSISSCLWFFPPQHKSMISNEKQTFEWLDCLQSQVYTVTLQLHTEKPNSQPIQDWFLNVHTEML